MASANIADLDTSSPRHLRGKYAICGDGETTYRRGSDQTTRSLATWAVGNAMADAGMTAGDIDGMLSYSFNDHSFQSIAIAPEGFPARFRRHSLRVGFTMWLPMIPGLWCARRELRAHPSH